MGERTPLRAPRPTRRPNGRDQLTDLGDREELERRGALLLAHAEASGHLAALLLVDLDSLKHLNDSAGHVTGDAVLAETASRLRAVIGPDDVLVRWGGDEFAVLTSGPGVRHREERADALLGAFHRPFEVADLSLAVDASVGLACFPEDGTTIEALLRAADQAMYAAKADGGGRWRAALRGPGGSTGSPARLVDDLRSPDLADQVVVHFQPQLDARTRCVVGFEGLARWQHPRLGLIPARSFVPLAEQQQLMRPITDAVVSQALDALPELRRVAPGSRLALNMTRRHILDSTLLVGIADQLRRRSLDPDQLLLEITEPVTRAGATPQPVFDLLHQIGIGVSICGYGRTWSSLTALWNNPAVREVKLHPLLVRAVPEDPDSSRLVRALVAGAAELGLRVVAEGIEDAAGLAAVTSSGCDVVQGILIAGPDALGETVAWVDQHQHAPH